MNPKFFSLAAMIVALCAAATIPLVACRPLGTNGVGAGVNANTNTPENAIMKPSVTYLHLLRKTPFFTGLNKDQLRWTIDHSREWEAQPGTVILNCGAGNGADDAIWILLDGGWQLEAGGKIYPAGHADAGKWFSGVMAQGECRLRTTEHSYVMKITRDDLADMLRRGFAFDGHLEQGRAYYRRIFDGGASRQ